ncbi:hypothetical protein SLA2020_512990 [Shorea laevis]
MNSVFHQILSTSLTLIQVIEYYEQKAEDMRQGERDEDFHCKNGSFTDLINHGGILGHATTIYTVRVLQMFKEVFFKGLGMNCIEVEKDETRLLYELNKPSSKRVLKVKFDKSDFSISCTCKLFETLGLLCRHALRVLLVNNVNQIPVQYITHRWTKNARKRVTCEPIDSHSADEKSSRLLRFSELNHLGLNVFDKGAFTAEGTKIAKMKLMEALELIENDLGSTTNDVAIELHADENKVADPPCVKKKGLTNARIKSQLEKKKRKKTKSAIPSNMAQKKRGETMEKQTIPKPEAFGKN